MSSDEKKTKSKRRSSSKSKASKKVSSKESKQTVEKKNEVSKDDFVTVEYTLWKKVNSELKIVETTDEKLAKEAGIYDEKEKYGPKFLIVGEGWYPSFFEELLIGMHEGETKKVELPPEKAFGERDLTKIENIPLRKFRKEGIIPRPGDQVRVGFRAGTVLRVGSGRVIVDFNHPLAGATVVYEIKVQKIIQNPEDKIKQLILRRIPDMEIEKVHISIHDNTVEIHFPDIALYYRDIGVAKRGIANDIFKYFSEITHVRFIEELVKPEEKSEKLEEAKQQ
ncbi:MAG: FKBP-type peptidyl-prolyl cis-trans isomerase [Candidatus Asgardarchaeia archaeon]